MWAHVYSCTQWLGPRSPPLPPHLGSYTRAPLVSRDKRRLFVTPCYFCKVVLGVDSVDFTKGLTHRLHAFERLLEKYHIHRYMHGGTGRLIQSLFCIICYGYYLKRGDHGPNNYKDTMPLMSSLVVFNRVYRLEIRSDMSVFLAPLVS